MSDVRPSKPRCLTCGHLTAYHRGPRCLGSTKYDVGMFVSNEDRCPCTLPPDLAETVASLVCPFCGEPPFATVSSTQWICGTDDCPCFMWNPLQTREENRRNAAPIKITDNDPKGSED